MCVPKTSIEYLFSCLLNLPTSLDTEELVLLNCGVGEDSWESLGLQRDPTSPSLRKSVLSIHWKDWCWSWNSNTLAAWCEELTYLKRPWCWERLKAGGEGDNRGWDGWMALLTQWTWVWVNSRGWWWTGRPGVLQFTGSQRVGHDWMTELNWPAWRGLLLYSAFLCLLGTGASLWTSSTVVFPMVFPSYEILHIAFMSLPFQGGILAPWIETPA